MLIFFFFTTFTKEKQRKTRAWKSVRSSPQVIDTFHQFLLSSRANQQMIPKCSPEETEKEKGFVHIHKEIIKVLFVSAKVICQAQWEHLMKHPTAIADPRPRDHIHYNTGYKEKLTQISLDQEQCQGKSGRSKEAEGELEKIFRKILLVSYFSIFLQSL